jgi:hypothetical protein
MNKAMTGDVRTYKSTTQCTWFKHQPGKRIMKKSAKVKPAAKKSKAPAVKTQTPTIDTLPHVTLENLGTTPTIDTPVKKVPKTKTPKVEKSKRISLNPQPTIDAKVAALKELGLKLTYAGRKWKAKDREFTSLEMSKYSVQEFAKLFAAK